MPGPHIGKGVNIIHFPGGQRKGRRILNHEQASVIGLTELFGPEGIRISVLNGITARIGLLVPQDLLKRRQEQGILLIGSVSGLKDRSPDKSHVPDIQAGIQGIRDFHNTVLSHSIGDKIRSRIQQDRPAYLVRPVIVMAQTAQAGFDPSDNDGRVFISPADQIAVDNDRVVRPSAHNAAGTIGVLLPVTAGDGIMVDHGIHIAGGDQETQTGFSQYPDTFRVFPVRLADHAHCIAMGLQDPADNGAAEAGMVHVGIPADIYKIQPVQAGFFHILSIHR